MVYTINIAQLVISIHTPTQGVTDIPVLLSAYFDISIYTPTQGVTWYLRATAYILHISIHTPTQGVTKFNAGRIHKLFDFNPHSHTGSDTIIPSAVLLWIISIHTPTQGVTFVTAICSDDAAISIHTPTQGVTRCLFIVPHLSEFQSTLPRRE